jgi:GH24 family phage-related lysozyme (muramidase)
MLSALFIMSAMTAPAGASEAGSGERMAVSEAGIRLIEKFEGFSKYEYSDSDQWYIGYGTSCDEGDYPDGISEEDAKELLVTALEKYEDSVNDFLRQYDILQSFSQLPY